VHPNGKQLLIRADFALGNRPGGDRLSCKRWRRLLTDALPGLMGCAHRCPKATVRLHDGDSEASYTGWLRIPIHRRPSKKRVRRFKAKLRARLESGLLPVDGRVLKLGVRRLGARRAAAPLNLDLPNGGGETEIAVADVRPDLEKPAGEESVGGTPPLAVAESAPALDGFPLPLAAAV
jgi:hypothetical protein